MATPGFPLPLRNALAALAIAALEDDDAHAAVAWLADRTGPPPAPAARRLADVHLVELPACGLLPVHAAHADAVGAHALRAERAAATHRRAGANARDPLAAAVAQAAALWDERLFFEVHEVLETVWKSASGAPRQALQGVIQIAVAFHHLAHGNRRGARTLMREGRTRLATAPAALSGLDASALLEATAPWEHALTGSAPLPATPPRFPRR